MILLVYCTSALSAVALLPFIASTAQAQGVPLSNAAARATAIEEIVVTAQKREERLLSVPISVQAIGAEELNRRQIIGIEDLAQVIPNFSFAEFGDGQYRLTYRGIGASGASTNQTFSTAIDGLIVPYNRAFRDLDLQRVEVLRGPQGTLFGRNSVAGVVNLVARDGSEEEPQVFSFSAGTRSTFEVSGGLGGRSQSSGVFGRIAARYGATNGFFKNPTLGRRDGGEEENVTARGTVGWANEAWLVKLAVTYDEYDNIGDNLTVFRLQRPRVSTASALGYSKGKMVLPVATVRRTFDTFEVTSITAYADTERDLNFHQIVAPILNLQLDTYESFSQELRFASTEAALDGRLTWLVGLYYLNEDNLFATRRTLNGTIIPGAFSARPETRRKTDTYAAFGQADFALTEKFRISAGLRVAHEKQTARAQTDVITNSPLIVVEDDYTPVLPKLTLSYFFTPEQHIYGSVTRGFRSGFFFINNTNNPFVKPEYTWQYEAGYKAAFAEKFNIALSGFYIDWKDLQVQRAIGLNLVVVDNAASARSYGGEIEAGWQVSNSLRLGLSGGLTNAKYRRFNPAPGQDFSGKFIEYAPKYSLGGNLLYSDPSGAFIGTDLTLHDGRWLDNANTARDDDYVLWNAQIGFDAGWYRVTLAGKNLLNEDYVTRGVTAPGFPFLVYYADPLSVHLQLALRL